MIRLVWEQSSLEWALELKAASSLSDELYMSHLKTCTAILPILHNQKKFYTEPHVKHIKAV